MIPNAEKREPSKTVAMYAKSEGREAKFYGQRWHYLAVRKSSVLLRGITSKNNGDFYCSNCLHFLRTKKKPESHKKVCENKVFCNVIMPPEDTKKLEFNQCQKSDKAPFNIYADLECLIEKINGCRNNPENSSTAKVSEHIPSGFLMSTISSFRSIENKHGVYRVFLFYCCKKMFILINIWMIRKNLMKDHYLKKKIFVFT